MCGRWFSNVICYPLPTSQVTWILMKGNKKRERKGIIEKGTTKLPPELGNYSLICFSSI
jgi:hypothetical protein